MDATTAYFIKANVAFIALYLFYRIFLHRDTFFKEKRFAFIFGFLFATMHPLIDVSNWIQSSEQAVAIARTLSNTLPVITIAGGGKAGFSVEEIVLISYTLVLVTFFIRILWQVGTVIIFAVRGKKETRNGQVLIHLPKGSAPFSFFGWIFINPEEHSAQDLEEILHHEKAHAHQHHTLDVLFAEIACMIFWINPFAWLLKRHLRENLEYLADKDVIHSGFDQKSYQYHLLRLSYQHSTTKMGNNFNVSQLKNRITMMNKKRTSLAGLSKYALSLPLFALLFLSAYAWGAKQNMLSVNNLKEISSISELKQKAQTLLAVNDNKKKTTAVEPIESKKIDVAKEVEVDNKNSILINGKRIQLIPKTHLNTINVIGTVTKDTKYAEPQPQITNATVNPDIMPEFPGGTKALEEFITSNINYPVAALECRYAGPSIIIFIINESGEVVEAAASTNSNAMAVCDAEALRVVNSMPKWTPGKLNGKNVRVAFTLPILFQLQGELAPASNTNIFSDNANKPLCIVDGVEKPYTEFKKIATADISSITVLKNAAATSLFGDKGKNGVLKVELKKKN